MNQQEVRIRPSAAGVKVVIASTSTDARDIQCGLRYQF